jgi:uncharacterized protein YhbP (UPF0306 family)
VAEAKTRARIAGLLGAQSTLSLATLGASGDPMAASLFFAAADDLRLYWLSAGTSRHSLNLARRPTAAVTIHNQTWAWPEIAGVQMQGQASLVAPGEPWQAAWTLYAAKFPFVTGMQAEVMKSSFYVFTASWMRLVDNRLGFGHKEEIGILE